MIKPCQKKEFEGLNLIQLQYAYQYGYSKDELNYRDFDATVQRSHRDYPKHHTVSACCREHACDMYEGVVSCSY